MFFISITRFSASQVLKFVTLLYSFIRVKVLKYINLFHFLYSIIVLYNLNILIYKFHILYNNLIKKFIIYFQESFLLYYKFWEYYLYRVFIDEIY